MKQGYAVAWSETAERDLLSIIDYIADDNPSRAYDIFRGVKRQASSLRLFPEVGRIVPEL